jgi:hypothetical protein
MGILVFLTPIRKEKFADEKVREYIGIGANIRAASLQSMGQGAIAFCPDNCRLLPLNLPMNGDYSAYPLLCSGYQSSGRGLPNGKRKTLKSIDGKRRFSVKGISKQPYQSTKVRADLQKSVDDPEKLKEMAEKNLTWFRNAVLSMTSQAADQVVFGGS